MVYERTEYSRHTTRGEDEAFRSPTLKETLLFVTFSKNRAVPDELREIALGYLKHEADELWKLTVDDPRKREMAKLVFVTHDNRIIISTKPISGSESRVTASHDVLAEHPTLRMSLPKRMRQDVFLGTFMHTHGLEDLPPSPRDMLNLLVGDESEDAATAVFVITETRRMLLFRGHNTPQLSYDEASQKTSSWREALFNRSLVAIPPSASKREVSSLGNRMQMALLRDVSKHYDLKMFIGDSNTEVVTRHTFPPPPRQ